LTQENSQLKQKIAQIQNLSASQGNTIQILQESLKTLKEEKETTKIVEVESPAATTSENDKILIVNFKKKIFLT